MRNRRVNPNPAPSYLVSQYGPSGAFLWETPYFCREHAYEAAEKAAFGVVVKNLVTGRILIQRGVVNG